MGSKINTGWKRNGVGNSADNLDNSLLAYLNFISTVNLLNEDEEKYWVNEYQKSITYHEVLNKWLKTYVGVSDRIVNSLNTDQKINFLKNETNLISILIEDVINDWCVNEVGFPTSVCAQLSANHRLRILKNKPDLLKHFPELVNLNPDPYPRNLLKNKQINELSEIELSLLSDKLSANWYNEFKKILSQRMFNAANVFTKPDKKRKFIETLSGAQHNDLCRATLVNANLRLVVNFAKKYRRLNIPITDLIGEGNIGLVIAIEKFEPHRNLKLSTYATWWIKQRILRFITRNSNLIRVPEHTVDLINSISRIRDVMIQELEREPNDVDLALAVKICYAINEFTPFTYDDIRLIVWSLESINRIIEALQAYPNEEIWRLYLWELLQRHKSNFSKLKLADYSDKELIEEIRNPKKVQITTEQLAKLFCDHYQVIDFSDRSKIIFKEFSLFIRASHNAWQKVPTNPKVRSRAFQLDLTEVARNCDLPLAAVRQFNNPPYVLSLDAGFEYGESSGGGEDSESQPLYAKVSSDKDDPFITILGTLTVRKLLSNLNIKERFVLCHRYGLKYENFDADLYPMTLSEIATSLNMSRERIRQLEMRALNKLRRLMMKESGHSE